MVQGAGSPPAGPPPQIWPHRERPHWERCWGPLCCPQRVRLWERVLPMQGLSAGGGPLCRHPTLWPGPEASWVLPSGRPGAPGMRPPHPPCGPCSRSWPVGSPRRKLSLMSVGSWASNVPAQAPHTRPCQRREGQRGCGKPDAPGPLTQDATWGLPSCPDRDGTPGPRRAAGRPGQKEAYVSSAGCVTSAPTSGSGRGGPRPGPQGSRGRESLLPGMPGSGEAC